MEPEKSIPALLAQFRIPKGIKNPGAGADWRRMIRRLSILAVAAIVAAAPAHSLDVFQCVDEHGALRFVDRPEACEEAELHEIRGWVEGVRETKRLQPGAELPASGAPLARDLGELLLTARQAGPGWEVVTEAPSQVGGDSDFASWGVRAQLARHYTRQSRGLGQVCSIEIWSFKSVYDARVAAEHISYPAWQIDREDEMLVMIHGVTLAIEGQPQRGVFPACKQLGEQQRLRLAEAVAR